MTPIAEHAEGGKSMKLLAIDPGDVQSAYVVLFDGAVILHGTVPNEDMRRILRNPVTHLGAYGAMIDTVVIEMIASYGMPVGREVFDTCLWIGRFFEIASDAEAHLVYRREVKMELCGRNNAKDPNVRQSLIDRFGPGKDRAIGKAKTPGPLYGIKGDEWSALAVAVTFMAKLGKPIAA